MRYRSRGCRAPTRMRNTRQARPFFESQGLPHFPMVTASIGAPPGAPRRPARRGAGTRNPRRAAPAPVRLRRRTSPGGFREPGRRSPARTTTPTPFTTAPASRPATARRAALRSRWTRCVAEQPAGGLRVHEVEHEPEPVACVGSAIRLPESRRVADVLGAEGERREVEQRDRHAKRRPRWCGSPGRRSRSPTRTSPSRPRRAGRTGTPGSRRRAGSPGPRPCR